MIVKLPFLYTRDGNMFVYNVQCYFQHFLACARPAKGKLIMYCTCSRRITLTKIPLLVV